VFPPPFIFTFFLLEQLVDEGQTFDIICGLEVIEHVKDPQAFLSILCSMLKVSRFKFQKRKKKMKRILDN